MSKNSKKGFTIIEVVLVLAIAGLIFLMVFIALPALQRGQRNTQRRSDMGRIVSAVTDFQTNHKNQIPNSSNISDFQRYVGAGDSSSDPDGQSYNFNVDYTGANAAGVIFKTGTDATVFPNNHTVYIVGGAYCGIGEGVTEAASGPYQFAVLYMLEGNSITCTDNQ